MNAVTFLRTLAIFNQRVLAPRSESYEAAPHEACCISPPPRPPPQCTGSKRENHENGNRSSIHPSIHPCYCHHDHNQQQQATYGDPLSHTNTRRSSRTQDTKGTESHRRQPPCVLYLRTHSCMPVSSRRLHSRLQQTFLSFSPACLHCLAWYPPAQPLLPSAKPLSFTLLFIYFFRHQVKSRPRRSSRPAESSSSLFSSSSSSSFLSLSLRPRTHITHITRP